MAMHLVRVNPWQEMNVLRREMDRLFEDRFPRRYGHDGYCVRLPVDAYVTDDELVLTVAIPGVSAENVDVTYDNEALTIKGELPGPLDGVDYLMRERAYGEFQRTIQIGIPVDADKIEAAFEHGVLTVTLPKVEEAKPKTIEVKAE